MLSQSDVLAIANNIRDKFPSAWRNCHNYNSPERFDYIILVARECFRVDKQVGCNWKRGVTGDLSMDAINYHGRIVDIVANAGGPNPSLYWNDVTNAAPGALVDPFTLDLHNEETAPAPTPLPSSDVVQLLRDIKEELVKLNRKFDWGNNDGLFRHTAEVCTKLDQLINKP